MMVKGNTSTICIDREPDGATTNTDINQDGAIKVAIGADIHNNTRYVKGKIDDVLIYPRVLGS